MDKNQLKRLLSTADKLEIMDLSSNYMRGLDRLDGNLERSVFWDNAFCSYGTYEGGPDGFVEYCQSALKSHLSNHHFGQINIEIENNEGRSLLSLSSNKDANDNQRMFL